MISTDPVLASVFKKFPTISDETRKISAALAIQESKTSLVTGFLPYAFACHNLMEATTSLRKANKDLDAELQKLSQKVQTAYSKIAPSEFFQAIRNNDAKTVEKILKISRLQDKPLSNGELPLHYAIRYGSHDVVQFFISKAEVNPLCKDHQGMTAFDHAYLSRSQKMIALVMSASLGTNIPERAFSKKVDNLEMQKLLQEIQKLSRPPVSYLQPLQAAAFLGDLETLEKLYKKTDINAHDSTGMSALHYAILGGKEPVVKWLLAKGAKIEDRAANGMNVLHLAAISGSDAILKLLLEMKKLDPNAADAQGRTPLHFAVVSEQLTLAKLLVQSGGDLLQQTMKTSPFDMIHFIYRIKAEHRDPLKLDKTPALFLASSVTSLLCQYFAASIKGGESGYLAHASRFFGALPALATLWDRSRNGPIWQKIPAHLSFYPTVAGYLLNDQNTQSISGGVFSLSLLKSLSRNLRISWRNSAMETYRPLRNIFIHAANALFGLYEFAKAAGIKKTIVCQLGTSEQCIVQDDLNPQNLGDAKLILNCDDRTECKTNYRNLGLIFHPDKHPGQTEHFNKLFAKIADAYKTIESQLPLPPDPCTLESGPLPSEESDRIPLLNPECDEQARMILRNCITEDKCQKKYKALLYKFNPETQCFELDLDCKTAKSAITAKISSAFRHLFGYIPKDRSVIDGATQEEHLECEEAHLENYLKCVEDREEDLRINEPLNIDQAYDKAVGLCASTDPRTFGSS